MVRGLLNKLVSRSLTVAGQWQQQQLRRLNIHEYQVPYFSFCFFYYSYVIIIVFLLVFVSQKLATAFVDLCTCWKVWNFFWIECEDWWILVCGNQGAELMAKYGINVPKGLAVASVDEVKKAIQDAFPDHKEVNFDKFFSITWIFFFLIKLDQATLSNIDVECDVAGG